MGRWWRIEKKLDWGDFTLWKCYVQGILRKKRYHGFFCGAPKINGWYTWNFSRKWQIKINKQDSWISTLKVLYKSNISISLVEHVEFPDYINFIHAILAGSDQWKLANRIQFFFHYLITMYRVIHKRSNVATSFAEHREFPE